MFPKVFFEQLVAEIICQLAVCLNAMVLELKSNTFVDRNGHIVI